MAATWTQTTVRTGPAMCTVTLKRLDPGNGPPDADGKPTDGTWETMFPSQPWHRDGDGAVVIDNQRDLLPIAQADYDNVAQAAQDAADMVKLDAEASAMATDTESARPVPAKPMPWTKVEVKP